MREPDSSPIGVIDQVRLAAQYDKGGNRADAEATLRGIDNAALEREYEESKRRVPSAIRPAHTIDAATRAGSGVSIEDRLVTFRRDRFTCRYCRKRTIFGPILRALSLSYPEAFPYHPNWALGKGHLIYWTHYTLCGHVEPISRGGTSKPDNFITACPLCIMRKGNARLEELGWELLPAPTRGYWDGLSSLFRELCFVHYDLRRSGEIQKWYEALI